MSMHAFRIGCIAALACFGLGPGAWSLEPVAVAAQEKTVEQGVYTTAQAARGAKTFETNCTGCHREPGGTAPILAGERFTKTFGDATLQTVFTTIKTTMPRNAPGTLTDAEYTDIVAHLLRINSYADGMSELALADMPGIKIPGQSGSLDQALVQVVGCLSRSGRNWTLIGRHRPGTDPRSRAGQGRRGGAVGRPAGGHPRPSVSSRSSAARPDGPTSGWRPKGSCRRAARKSASR